MPLQVHASAFAYHGMGCLVMGPSGSGKSCLVAQAVSLGGTLIADDQLYLHRDGDSLLASPLARFEGVMELRGFGLIRRHWTMQPHPIHLAIELTARANERLPEPLTREFAEVLVPFLQIAPFPALHVPSLLLYLEAMQAGRILPPDWHPKG